jgi:hypothetical protein
MVLAALVSAGASGGSLKDLLEESRACVWTSLGVRLCGPGKCAFNGGRFPYCAPKNGGITISRGGQELCGVGECLANRSGSVYCSSVKGGSAWYAGDDEIDCTFGCVQGDPGLCVPGKVNEPWRPVDKPMQIRHPEPQSGKTVACISRDDQVAGG